MEEDELDCIIEDTLTMLDFRAIIIFQLLDTDKSGTLSIDEIRVYL